MTDSKPGFSIEVRGKAIRIRTDRLFSGLKAAVLVAVMLAVTFLVGDKVVQHYPPTTSINYWADRVLIGSIALAAGGLACSGLWGVISVVVEVEEL